VFSLGAILFHLLPFPQDLVQGANHSVTETRVSVGPEMTLSVIEAEAAENNKRPAVPEFKHSRIKITKIQAGQSGNAPWVRIAATGRPKVSSQYLANPNRLLVIVQNAVLGFRPVIIPSGRPPLLRIRSAQHDQDVWVVLDLADTQKWTVHAQTGALMLQPVMVKAVSVVSTSARPAILEKVQASVPKNGLLSAPPVVGAEYQVVDVSAENQGERTRLTVTTDGLARYRVKSEKQGREFILEIYGAGLSGQLSVPGLPAGVVDKVAVLQQNAAGEPVVVITVQLSQSSPYLVSRDQNQIIIEFNNTGRIGAGSQRGDLNTLISVDFENANLDSVLRALAQQAGFDLVLSPNSQDKSGSPVTLTINEQPLRNVLDFILRPLHLSYGHSGNTLHVGLASEFPPETLVFTLKNLDVKNSSLKNSIASAFSEGSQDRVVEDEYANRVIVSAIPGDMARIKEIIATMDTPRRLVTKNFKLTYNQASKLLPLVQAHVSSLGSVKEAASENLLVVTDIPGNLESIGRLIRSLDIKAQQVMIEARIVEIALSNEQDLGVSWNTRKDDPNANPQLAVRSQPSVAGAVGQILVGTLINGIDLNAQLRVLEAKGRANTISNPRIATLNNQVATLNASQNIPYRTSNVSNGVVSNVVNYLELPITLTVTPQISDEQVLLNPLTLTVTTVVGDQNPPATTSRTATTQMLVNDGETIAIGGMVRDEERTEASQVPLLGDIPLLGYLFKSTVTVKNKVELVVFLTPHILK
jgi:type II secretory pathway component GspD/PulD (secretin)